MVESLLPAKLNVYSKLILAIENDSDDDPLWQRFYQLQMTSYLLSKKNLEFMLEEAEEAYEMIVDTWTDLKTYMEHPVVPIKDLDNLFKNIVIEFPMDELSISDTDNNDHLFYGSF